ncbi:hypothetical protein ACJRO7_025744 [Eucalyptus globulus]|uniref:Flotillin-like n=1 Tax=Eucalyptus globulus TaxID=34317 RepID=A0ABD3KM53_EUCGL
MWRVAGPSEYLAITGGFIKDVKLAKKAWIWPTQKCVKFHVSPVNYTFKVRDAYTEKLPFFIHAVFTIGPRVTDHKSLLLYAKLFASHGKPSVREEYVVQNIIHGQTCVLAASKTMEHIFKEILEKLELKLNQFGLVIYKANLEEAAKAKIKKVEIKVTGTVKIFKNQKKAELAEGNARSQSSKLAKVEYLVELLLWNFCKVQEANWELHKNERMAEAQEATVDATLYGCQQEDEGIQAQVVGRFSIQQ